MRYIEMNGVRGRERREGGKERERRERESISCFSLLLISVYSIPGVVLCSSAHRSMNNSTLLVPLRQLDSSGNDNA